MDGEKEISVYLYLSLYLHRFHPPLTLILVKLGILQSAIILSCRFSSTVQILINGGTACFPSRSARLKPVFKPFSLGVCHDVLNESDDDEK